MAALLNYLSAHSLLIATHNKGKLAEINALLDPLNIHCISAADKQLAEPVEDGDSFVKNAMIKSIAATHAVAMPSLSDDSGLVVPALGGDPGIYSARWAGPNKDFNLAMDKVKSALQKVGAPLDSPAYFVCAFSLALPDFLPDLPDLQSLSSPQYEISTALEEGLFCINIEGRVHGRLSFPPLGDSGFGYDPIFIAKGTSETFAQIPAEQKQRISHRANAFAGLVKALMAK